MRKHFKMEFHVKCNARYWRTRRLIQFDKKKETKSLSGLAAATRHYCVSNFVILMNFSIESFYFWKKTNLTSNDSIEPNTFSFPVIEKLRTKTLHQSSSFFFVFLWWTVMEIELFMTGRVSNRMKLRLNEYKKKYPDLLTNISLMFLKLFQF